MFSRFRWKAISVPGRRSRACLTCVKERTGTGIDSAVAANKWVQGKGRMQITQAQWGEKKKGM